MMVLLTSPTFLIAPCVAFVLRRRTAVVRGFTTQRSLEFPKDTFQSKLFSVATVCFQTAIPESRLITRTTALRLTATPRFDE
jgi:hypothetical protein